MIVEELLQTLPFQVLSVPSIYTPYAMENTCIKFSRNLEFSCLLEREEEIKCGRSKINMMPIISKTYCSSSQVVLMVRRRPHVVNGGGFVVTDCSQQAVFRVDGCGILCADGELMLRDGCGDPVLLIRRKGGILEALSVHKKWKGYAFSYEGSPKLVFSLKEPNKSCCVGNPSITIAIEPKENNSVWDFEVKGYFPDKSCSIADSKGNVVAQVGVRKDVEAVMKNKDVYYVVVKPGTDQAFVFGVIAVLDYIHGESTRC